MVAVKSPLFNATAGFLSTVNAIGYVSKYGNDNGALVLPPWPWLVYLPTTNHGTFMAVVVVAYKDICVNPGNPSW